MTKPDPLMVADENLVSAMIEIVQKRITVEKERHDSVLAKLNKELDHMSGMRQRIRDGKTVYLVSKDGGDYL